MYAIRVGPLKFLMAIQHCEKQAIARAIADVNDPTLTQYYLASGDNNH